MRQDRCDREIRNSGDTTGIFVYWYLARGAIEASWAALLATSVSRAAPDCVVSESLVDILDSKRH